MMLSSFLRPKIILISGSSCIIKGIVPANIGVLLKANGYHVTIIKMDPCGNFNAANLNPSKYGELYVFDDGEVAQQSFSYYQRFLNQTFTTKHNLTNGKINDLVKNNEQKGHYGGDKIVSQHYVSAIINWIKDLCKQPIIESNAVPEICIIELCGIINDPEMKYFTEALKNFKDDKKEFMHIHVGKIIGGSADGLLNYVQTLRNQNWKPDVIVCRSRRDISDVLKEEIAKYSSLKTNQVINLVEDENINCLPLLFQQRNVYELIAEKLNLKQRPIENNIMHQWKDIVSMSNSYKHIVKIALVGKYFKHPLSTKENEFFRDSYASVIHALNDAGLEENCKVETIFVWAEDLEVKAPAEKQFAVLKLLEEAHGIVITAGFNVPGFEGMMEACKFAREKMKPLLAICYGMQCAIIEFAQNVCGIKGAWSTKLWNEQNEKCNGVLEPLKPEQEVIIRMWEDNGKHNERLRLGRRTTHFLTKNSELHNLYGQKSSIQERHRHGYEVNPKFVPLFMEAGLRFVGLGVDEVVGGDVENISEATQNLLKIAQTDISENEESYVQKVRTLCDYGIATGAAVRMEVMELKDHPYYIGVEFHPEFQSRPTSASPPFMGLVHAAIEYSTST